LDRVRDYYIRYQKEQFQGLIGFLEQQTGQKLDRERLWEAIRLGDEAWRLWYEIDRLRTAVPSPMPTQDHFSVMVAGHYFSGTRVAVDFYQGLYNEVTAKAENKIGVIPPEGLEVKEKYRLLYGGGLPPWHTLWIFNYFESCGGWSPITGSTGWSSTPAVPAGRPRSARCTSKTSWAGSRISP
jgi:benzoyl-CoA reductase/2-hydroxyglutaryl-CoA dehydratase subunit BcrC/BadD/HgdB